MRGNVRAEQWIVPEEGSGRNENGRKPGARLTVAPGSSTENSETQVKIILIVEDDEGIRQTMRIVLETMGFKVFTADDGRAGLELLSRIPRPDLIVLDLMMPVMNGWEFAAEVDKDASFSKVPRVVVTAFSEQAKGIRAEEIVTKPFNLDTFLNVVKRFCGSGDE